MKKILTAVLCAWILLGTAAFAAELKAGDVAYVVYGGSVNVTKKPRIQERSVRSAKEPE